MTLIAPFKALRPKPDFASQVASPPYDVLNSEEARQAAAGNPYSFLHVTKSEIDLPTDVHAYSKIVYEKAGENIRSLIQQGVLEKESKPCFYLYRLIMQGRSQTGLVSVSSVDDYLNGVIRKHEFTRPEKELDRINHMTISGAQTGNVFLAYNNVADMDALVDKRIKDDSPLFDFKTPDGIQHTIWRIEDDATIERITNIFKEQVPCTYIADGHHRAASAAKVRAALGNEAGPAADYFLTTLFPASQLQIMDYNRVIKDLNEMTPEYFISALQDDFLITQSEEPVRPVELHEFGMYLNGQWYILKSRAGSYAEDPMGVLDVTILSNNVFDKLLDIKDQRTDKRIDFVGGIRGLAELEKRVDSGEMAVAFSFFPVSIQQLFDIADSGKVMPPKSTWFEPKLRDGLLTHLIRLIILFLFISFSAEAQQDIAQLRETAITFQRQGDYSNALLVLNKALQQQPNDIEVLTDIAYTHYLQKDYVKALEVIKPLLDKDDATVRTYQVSGNVYKAIEEVKECDKMYKKALKKYPGSGVLNSEYGELLWAKKEPEAAISQWEKGIQADPSYSGNYYHAAKYYYAMADKVWSLVYAEIFLNLESYSTRTAEIKTLLLESYKKFFTQSDVFKQYNERKKTPFEETYLLTLGKQSSLAAQGVTTNSLIMIRTRFILDWFEGPAAKYPHRMMEQQQYLIREGMFDAYNQWLFGATANILDYQQWTSTHAEEQSRFTYYQRNRVFKMPPGQFYGGK